MSSDFAVHALLGLLPVSCFLAVLVWLDSYKLVRIRWSIATIGLGCVAAGLSYGLNNLGLRLLNIEFVTYTRFVAPVLEESSTRSPTPSCSSPWCRTSRFP
jgi:drug/metabolite transporter (DMT)-like permease